VCAKSGRLLKLHRRGFQESPLPASFTTILEIEHSSLLDLAIAGLLEDICAGATLLKEEGK
jgi:hypothetical protein